MNNKKKLIIITITGAKLLHFYVQTHKTRAISEETAPYFDVGQKPFQSFGPANFALRRAKLLLALITT